MMVEIVDGLFEVRSGESKTKLDAATIFASIFRPSTDDEFELRAALKSSRPGIKFEAQVSCPVLRVASDSRSNVVLELGLHNSETKLSSFPSTDYFVDNEVWRPLDIDEFKRFENLVSSSGISVGQPLSPEEFSTLVWRLGLDIEINVDQKTIFTAFELQARGHIDADLLNATLFPYQESGAQFALASTLAGRGVLLADEMGLGKTIQAIYVLASLHNREGAEVRSSLVVVPSSNLANWIREFQKFAPNLPISLHYGSQRAGVLSSLKLASVVLTTYDVVARDIEFLEALNWSVVVLDEAQNIKNPGAQRSVSVKRLSRSSGLAISGTPIENSLSDLWSIFDFIQPGLLGDLEDFRFNYPDSPASATLLSRQVAPFTIRREVRDVAQDLPEKMAYEVPIFASGSMAREYSALREDPSISDLAKLTKLRQICGFSTHDSEQSPKISRLLGILEEVFLSKNKALVFASFTRSIDGVVNAIKSHFPYAYVETLDGRKTSQERQNVIDEFSATSSPGALIANPKAAGVGLNIQAANYVFHFTPEWNPAQVAQATARAHRRGQTKPVFVYNLFFKDSVEEYMLEILESKKKLLKEGFSAFNETQLSQTEVREALSRMPSAR